MELLGVFEVSRLLTLHSVDDDLMREYELLEVSFLVGFIDLKSLGEEVLSHGDLKFGRMIILIGDPARKHVGVGTRVFGEFCNLCHRLFDRFLMRYEIDEHCIIRVNSAWHLAMRHNAGSGGERKEGGYGNKGLFFHIT